MPPKDQDPISCGEPGGAPAQGKALPAPNANRRDQAPPAVIRMFPMPADDWLLLAHHWDMYEYCCLMEALMLGTPIQLWRAN